MAVNAFVSFTLAILLLFVGKGLTQRVALLRRYSIPEPVVGGFLCACGVGVVYLVDGTQIRFDLGMRDMLLLYFFAGIGLKSDVRTLINGGRPLMILLLLSSLFIVLQNVVGMAAAAGFGLDPRTGLLLGSISLVGGFGTTIAWTPDFVGRLGIANALELGTAATMVGLIAACVTGGPIANYLMRRHRLVPSADKRLDIGVPHVEADPPLDYYGVLRAWLWLNVTLLLGQGFGALLQFTGLNLPDFVSCLLAGIVLRNAIPPLLPRRLGKRLPGLRQGLALLSDLSLGMFLTMAVRGLQRWALHGV
ncbi:MAG: sodium/glutamate symporter, partial [Burkholderiales bacterium]|nr:sodium/glutamate symporter [Burkholderiales bacterium]